MVDLPQVPRRLTTIQTPQSNVQMMSEAAAAAPYRQLASALTQAGETAEKIAEPLAERAGYEAVTRDEKGDLQIAQVPIVGPAGAVYGRAARFAFLAQAQPEIENRIAELGIEFANDPAGFQTAAKAFAEKYTANLTDPMVKAPVARVLESTSAQTWRGLLVSNERERLKSAEVGFKSRLSDLANRSASLARQPGGVNSPEYVQLQADRAAIYGELGADKRYNYPPERIASELSEARDADVVQAIIGDGLRMYDKATPTAKEDAKKYILEQVWNPALNLSPVKRQQAVTQFMGALEGRSSENAAAKSAFGKEVTEHVESLKNGAPYNPVALNDLKARAVRLGDTASYSKLQAYEWVQPYRASLASLPLRDAVGTLRALRDSVGAGSLEPMLIRRESGGVASKVNQLGYSGLYQFGAPRLVDLGLYNPGASENLESWSKTKKDETGKWSGTFNIPGHPEVKTQADFLKSPAAQKVAYNLHVAKMDREIADNDLQKYEGQTVGGVLITRAGLHAMLHLGGVGGAKAALDSGGQNVARDANGTSVIDYARLGGTVTGESGSEAGRALAGVRQELVNDYRKKLSANVEDMVKTMETNLGKGLSVSADELRDMADAIRETGRHDLIPRLENAMQSNDGVKGVSGQPLSTQWAFRAALVNTAAKSGDETERKVIGKIVEGIDAMQAGMKQTPYTTASSIRGLHDAPGPLNFGDGAAFAAEIGRRNGFQSIQMSHDGTGPISVFEKVENEAFRGALAQATPEQVAGIFNALDKLDSGRLFATLDNDAVKDGMRGLLKVSDPAKLRAGMAALDRIYQRDPAETRRLLGDTAADRLRVWQANLSWMNDQQVLDEIKKVNDPQRAEVLKRNTAEGMTEARKMSVGDVVKSFDESWSITPGPIARALGSQPLPPVDPLVRDTMMGDWQGIYARFYADTLNSDDAKRLTVEKMKTKYARSEINGGRLMQNAPEQRLPAIGGSHAWVKEQIETDIAAHLNAKPGEFDYEIVPDQQTQADVTAGASPSYRVAVTDKRTGERKPIPGRWRADMTRHADKLSEFNEDARARQWLSWAGGAQRAHSMGALGLTEDSPRVRQGAETIPGGAARGGVMRMFGLTEDSPKVRQDAEKIPEDATRGTRDMLRRVGFAFGAGE